MTRKNSCNIIRISKGDKHGHYNYKYSSIRDTYKGELENPLLEDLLEDVVELLRSLEWYKSGDTSQETYHQNIDIFIEKWIKKDLYDSSR